jgi:hypothetical protein
MEEDIYKTFPTYKLALSKYPVRDNSVSRAFGLAFDHALARFTYYASRTSHAKNLENKIFLYFLHEFDNNVQLSHEERMPYLIKAWKMLRAFKTTVIFQRALLRERVRVVFIDDEKIAMYAQPDFVDHGREVIYEVKAHELKDNSLDHAKYQTKLFQLAYPNYEAVIIGFIYDGLKAIPQHIRLPPLTSQETKTLLNDMINYAKHEETQQQPLENIIFNRISIHYNKVGQHYEEPKTPLIGEKREENL